MEVTKNGEPKDTSFLAQWLCKEYRKAYSALGEGETGWSQWRLLLFVLLRNSRNHGESTTSTTLAGDSSIHSSSMPLRPSPSPVWLASALPHRPVAAWSNTADPLRHRDAGGAAALVPLRGHNLIIERPQTQSKLLPRIKMICSGDGPTNSLAGPHGKVLRESGGALDRGFLEVSKVLTLSNVKMKLCLR